MRFALALLPLLMLAVPVQIRTIAGDGTPGDSATRINNPYGLVVGPDGGLYFCEVGNHKVRRLDLKTGTLKTVAGTGQKGYSGDGGPATAANLNEPYELRFDGAGNLFFVEMQNHVLRRVDAKSGVISTVAGNGKPGFAGDGGPAAQAQFKQPHSIAFAPDGALLVCDIGNNRVRRIDLKSGTIDTYLGGGATPLRGPRAIAFDPEGNLYLVLREGNAVYRFDAQRDGKLIAGTGEKGYSGDGGPAVQARLSGPKGIAYGRGAVYIDDTESHTVRRIDLKSGVITTVVGTGEKGDGPDGDPLRCRLNRPHGIFIANDGTIYVGDSESHRIRMLKP